MLSPVMKEANTRGINMTEANMTEANTMACHMMGEDNTLEAMGMGTAISLVLHQTNP